MRELRRVREEAIVPLTDAFVSSGRLPHDWDQATEAVDWVVDLELLQGLTRRAAAMLPAEQIDSWLAPRLHNSVRLPRRLAADGGIWVWLALQCPEIIEARFGKTEGKVHPWRYRTVWSRNALARLWWGAEMTRNGPSYADVRHCFARTRTAQFTLELMYSWSRPAAIGFARVAEGVDEGPRLTDTQMKALSTRLKVYLSLRSLELGQVDREDTEEFDSEWASHTPSLTSLLSPDLASLSGPANGACEEPVIVGMCEWFRQIVSELKDTAPSMVRNESTDENEGVEKAR
jgi:hypothetical protein